MNLAYCNSTDSSPARGINIGCSTKVPYGYMRHPKTKAFMVDPDASRIVARIYALRSELYNLTAIADILNSEGIPSPSKLKYLRGELNYSRAKTTLWSRKTVRDILSDQVYIGNRVHGRDRSTSSKTTMNPETGIVVSDAHPPIIEKSLFEQVQRINEQETMKIAHISEHGRNNKTMLLGKLVCADCGKPLVSFARKSAKRKNPNSVFYECSDYHNFKRCSTHYIGDDMLTEALIDAIAATSNAVLIANRYGRDIGPQKKKLSALEKTSSVLAQKHTQLSLQLRDLYEQMSTGKITCAYRDEVSTAVKKERDALEARQKRLESQMNELKQQIQAILFFADAFKAYQRRPVLTQELANVMFDKIEVHTDSSIVIRFRLAGYQYTYIPPKP